MITGDQTCWLQLCECFPSPNTIAHSTLLFCLCPKGTLSGTPWNIIFFSHMEKENETFLKSYTRCSEGCSTINDNVYSGNQPPITGNVPPCSYSNQLHISLVTDWLAVCVWWMTSGGFVLPGHDATELHFPSAWPPFAFFRMIITHLLPSATCGRAADGPGNWNTGKQVIWRGKERQCKFRRLILRQAPGKGALHEWVAHYLPKLQEE